MGSGFHLKPTLLALWFLLGISSGAEPSRTNVILVMADDLGWKELGCYGQEKIRTPHIDRMASEGIRFTQFYTGAPVCAPARCNLMTGKHAGHAYIRNNGEIKANQRQLKGATIFGGQTPLVAGEITIAELFKSQGYSTGCFGKWGLGAAGTEGDPLKQGFDTFYGYNCQRHAHNLYPKYLDRDGKPEFLDGNSRGLTGQHYAPQLIADEMLKFVEQNHDKPFFVYYPTVIPHLPLQAPQDAIDAYRGRWEDNPYKGKSYLPHPTPRACYAAMITFMDDQMGRLFAMLEKKGIDGNTLVIFTSDNGTSFLSPQADYEFFDSVGELRGFKGSVYEGGIREPFVARWPGRIPAGRVSGHVGAHYDVLATLAEIVGAEVPAESDGISLLPELLGKSGQRKHDFLVWDFAGYGGQIAVRMGDWKGVKQKVKENPDAALELYNLNDDPFEQSNVAGRHSGIVEQIEAIIARERVRPEIEKFRFGNYVSED